MIGQNCILWTPLRDFSVQQRKKRRTNQTIHPAHFYFMILAQLNRIYRPYACKPR